MPYKAIFFDAGNTLVFPNLERTLEPLIARGILPSTEQLYSAERYAKQTLDATRLALALPGTNGTDAQYWQEYYSQLLEQLRHPSPRAKVQGADHARSDSVTIHQKVL